MLLAMLLLKFSTAASPLPSRLTEFVRNNDLSYGLYLYHMPIINFLLVLAVASASGNAVLTVGAGLLAACLSWYLVERPSLRRKRKAPRAPLPASN